MYKSIAIENFRAFQELRLESLARINLIAGANNVGKTSALEAIFLLSGKYKPDLLLALDSTRGLESLPYYKAIQGEDTPYSIFFHAFDTDRRIRLTGDFLEGSSLLIEIGVDRNSHQKFTMAAEDNSMDSTGVASTTKTAKVLRWEVRTALKTQVFHLIIQNHQILVEPHPFEPDFPTTFLTTGTRVKSEELAGWFTNISMGGRGRSERLVEIMKIIEPRLNSLTLAYWGKPFLYGDIGLGKKIPLFVMGEGMVRICNLVLAIMNSEGGVVLVDEIGNGLHHSVMSKVWEAIARTARESDVQVFATTHSLECIQAAHEYYASDGNYDFALHRLDNIKGRVVSFAYDQEALGAALNTGLEVRS